MATCSSLIVAQDKFLFIVELGKMVRLYRPQPTLLILTILLASHFIPSAPDPKWVYVANTTSVVRFHYQNGDLKARGVPETIVAKLPGYAQLAGGGHWTRDLAFSLDGKKLFVSVGSGSNVDDPDTHTREFHRADVLEFTPEGKFAKVYASGIRNCVGEAVNPTTGELWCSTNERDDLGNNLVPDYITHVQEDGFYRLALVVHWRPPGPPACRETSRIKR